MKWTMPNIGVKFKGLGFNGVPTTLGKGSSTEGVKAEPPMDRGEDINKLVQETALKEEERQRERSESEEMEKEDRESLLDNLDMFEIINPTEVSNQTDGELYMVVSLAGARNPLLEEYS